nr:nicotinamide-nucleotide amidohydrolase family protein [Sinosporangium siamense]
MVELLAGRRATLAVAESLTGGLIGARVTTVPGASAVFVGGVVSYATALKERLLGVPGDLLAAEGAVHPAVAEAMAAGVRDLCGASYGLAVTGVAGPEPQDGRPVGTVHAAVYGASGVTHGDFLFRGSRDRVRAATVEAAIDLLIGVLEANVGEQFG